MNIEKIYYLIALLTAKAEKQKHLSSNEQHTEHTELVFKYLP